MDDITLDNFEEPRFQSTAYILTSPRSLRACAKHAIKPVDLLPRSVEDLERIYAPLGYTAQQLRSEAILHEERRQGLHVASPLLSPLVLMCRAALLARVKAERLIMARAFPFVQRGRMQDTLLLCIHTGAEASQPLLRATSVPRLEPSASFAVAQSPLERQRLDHDLVEKV